MTSFSIGDRARVISDYYKIVSKSSGCEVAVVGIDKNDNSSVRVVITRHDNVNEIGHIYTVKADCLEKTAVTIAPTEAARMALTAYRSKCKRSGVGCYDAAEDIGMVYSTVLIREADPNTFKLNELALLAERLGVTLPQLLQGDFNG